jgi:hypothetical protein
MRFLIGLPAPRLEATDNGREATVSESHSDRQGTAKSRIGDEIAHSADLIAAFAGSRTDRNAGEIARTQRSDGTLAG